MPQWTKKILRKKGGIGTVANATEDADIKAPKLMEFIEEYSEESQSYQELKSLNMQKITSMSAKSK